MYRYERSKYEDIVIETLRKIIGKEIDEEEIFNLVQIYNDEELEMFLACVDKYKATDGGSMLLMYDLLIYKDGDKYCFVENGDEGDLDESRIIDERWYSLGYDEYLSVYKIQFEGV